MLIQFTVANYRSFSEPQTLSMVASGSLRRLRSTNTFSPPNADLKVPRLLRCAAVFGANASGKSNLVKALRFVERMVVDSAGAKPGRKIEIQPFRLSQATAKEDSKFELEFIEQGIRFQFGLTANTDRITSEWLIAYHTTRATELYRRDFNSAQGVDVYNFGRQLEGGRLRKDWAAQTGPTTLYLSRVVQASSDEFKQLRVPFNWFSKRLRVERHIETEPWQDSFSAEYCESEVGKKKVVDFLRGFDIPIADIQIEKKKIDTEKVFSMFSTEYMEKLKLTGDITTREPRFVHADETGNPVEFSPADESDGTMNLFTFSAKWLEVTEHDYVLVVDELDSSLHPLAVWELIRKLSESDSCAQLIFTTHDVTVLRSKLLRRDQVYFVSTDSKRSSALYSLQDFKGREEDSFEDRYLQGRYGATPVISR